MSLFKQSKKIIAETGRFYMSNVHDESVIIRYKCRLVRLSKPTMVYDTSSKEKKDGQMNSTTTVQWPLYLNKSIEYMGDNKRDGYSMPYS